MNTSVNTQIIRNNFLDTYFPPFPKKGHSHLTEPHHHRRIQSSWAQKWSEHTDKYNWWFKAWFKCLKNSKHHTNTK